jgi:hypothetical protein
VEDGNNNSCCCQSTNLYIRVSVAFFGQVKQYKPTAKLQVLATSKLSFVFSSAAIGTGLGLWQRKHNERHDIASRPACTSSEYISPSPNLTLAGPERPDKGQTT